MQNEQTPLEGANKDIGFFERYLSLWVALCIGAGIALGQFVPAVPNVLGEMTYAEVNLPVALLIWVMIFPMMLEVDFESIVDVKDEPRGLTITLVANWLIKPFSMFAIAWLFFFVIFDPFIAADLQGQYLAGAVLLGAAPCTAMVFVWSYLTDGDAGYTVVQVAINDIIMLFAFAPIVMFLLGLGDMTVPWQTVLASVVIYVVIPLTAGYVTRKTLIAKKGLRWFDEEFLPKFGPVTMIGLLATLVLLFSFQGEVILKNPLHIGLIAIPLVLQTFFIFAIAYGAAKIWNVRHCVAAPAALIGSSNFFELAVAAAIVLFGIDSGAALVTVVGVLVEVPLMLALVRIANVTKPYFPE
ncbi:MAG: ACR3 family arsenite efflux transporter [Persicimonas sp.]